MDETAPVARYALYGEPVQPVEPRFVHVEPIPLRSGPVAWRIAPHAHAELHQLLVVTAGGGRMRIEAETLRFAAPALLVVPAGLAHGFDFAPGTDGWIASVAETMLTPAIRGDPAVAALIARGRSVEPLAAEAVAALTAVFAALARELVWAGPAHRLAVEAELLRLLVLAARTLAAPPDPALDPADVALTDRFRQRIEARLRTGDPIAAYARALGVSQDRLLGACRRRFGEPPVRILNRRLLVEAQRWLIYTGRPVAEIGAALGFSDPTYFSRFFRRGTGASPRAYRTRAQGPGADPTPASTVAPIAEAPPPPHLAGRETRIREEVAMPETTPVETQDAPTEIFEPANTVLIGQDAIARRLGVTLKEAEALCAAGDLKAERTGEIWSVGEADLAAYLRDRDATA